MMEENRMNMDSITFASGPPPGAPKYCVFLRVALTEWQLLCNDLTLKDGGRSGREDDPEDEQENPDEGEDDDGAADAVLSGTVIAMTPERQAITYLSVARALLTLTLKVGPLCFPPITLL